MLLVGTSYQLASPSLIHPVLQPRRQRRDAARENGEDVRPRAGVGRQDRTLPQAAGAGMQSQACHNNRVGIELSTDLCEVAQFPEKAPTKTFSFLKASGDFQQGKTLVGIFSGLSDNFAKVR